MNQRILKNANGWIEIQRAEDDEIIYLFDPTGMIVSSHPSEPNAVTISKTPSNQDPNESIVIYMLEEDELTVFIGEDSYVIDSAVILKEKLALLFSKGGASGEGLGYRELYGRIKWDAATQKPVMAIDSNTLGFVPYFDNTGNNFSIGLRESPNDPNHPSIPEDVSKVHVYIKKRQELNKEVLFESGMTLEESIIYFRVDEVQPYQETVSINFNVEIPSSTQNINKNISFPVDVNGSVQTVNTSINFDVDIPSSTQNISQNVTVPSRQLVNITMQDGLTDDENFCNTYFHIVVVD